MTKQPKHDSVNLSPSLQAKLLAFAEGLTPEESEQLHTLQTEDVTGMLSPSLREKAQRVAEGLTAEEAAQLQTLLHDAETAGYMAPLYDDGWGYKGPPRPTEGTGGGGAVLGLASQKYQEQRDLALTIISLFKNPPLHNPF
ncbi:MAG: hypothetical protein ACRDJE_04530 [Dehalococcoidia bacterium]